MLDHHIQRSIVYKLAFTPHARFSELKPDDIENKLFTYHLKKVMVAGYVNKADDGSYYLSPEGRRLSTGVQEKQNALIVERPLSALFLIIRKRSGGSWLMYRRKTHPMIDFQGIMHVRPNAAESIREVAKSQCLIKTGLEGDFTPLGGGYIRVFEGDILESFTHFTLLYCDDIQGELQPEDKHAEYFWVDAPDYSDTKIFPATRMLIDHYQTKEQFFVDKTFSI